MFIKALDLQDREWVVNLDQIVYIGQGSRVPDSAGNEVDTYKVQLSDGTHFTSSQATFEAICEGIEVVDNSQKSHPEPQIPVEEI